MKYKIYNDVVVQIDEADYPLVSSLKWHVHISGYACHSVNERKKLFMHQLIMDAKMIDHINGDKLDNRKQNLRICTHQQNMQNSRPRKGTSPYKGVSWHNTRKEWRAQIYHNGKKMHLGSFATDVEAARAYNKKARELFGEFAYINEGI